MSQPNILSKELFSSIQILLGVLDLKYGQAGWQNSNT